jgi:dolichyl-phosphate-mannose--protein O-mannosyl transferase
LVSKFFVHGGYFTWWIDTRCVAGKLVVIAVAMAAPKSMIDRMKNNGFMVAPQGPTRTGGKPIGLGSM